MTTPTIVTITISGVPNSGKTTLAQLVADALRDAGFGVNVNDADLNAKSSPPHFHERLQALVEKDVLIDIVTVQTQTKNIASTDTVSHECDDCATCLSEGCKCCSTCRWEKRQKST